MFQGRTKSLVWVAALLAGCPSPPSPICGDGTTDVEQGEECDDGNNQGGDGCNPGCKLPVCGDGTVDAGELCDDGNPTDGDSCESDCTLPSCGNGIVDAVGGEE